jgi:NADH-quinone oxidoreductase E subunit
MTMENNNELAEILDKYKNAKRESTIPMLQDIQEKFGFLSVSSMKAVAEHLNISPAKVYGVASFYNQFKFHAPGKYHIQVCRGTACHVKGSLSIFENLKRVLGIDNGETTKDKMFSLEVVSCVGACGLAPVISVNGEYHAKLTPQKVKDIINNYRKEKNEL